MTDECAVLVLDDSNLRHPQEHRRMVDALPAAGTRKVVLITHHPPEALPPEDRAWLRGVLADGQLSLCVVGHQHVDRHRVIGDTDYHVVRGLDPDKAVGGPPALAMFDLHDGRWSRRDLAFAGGDVGEWTLPARREFLDHLGCSCMAATLRGLDRARRRRVACVEIRAAEALTVSLESLQKKVAAWRNACGRYLSIHMPNIKWDHLAGAVDGTRTWQASLELAMELKAEALTIHVPLISVARMRPESKAWNAVAEHFRGSLQPAMDRGMILSIENLHMRAGEPPDRSRGFGYLPDECLGWVRFLREATGYDRIGFHLDIGHARNNRPFSDTLTVGQWYALTGREITGYHLHQVVTGPQGMENHHPIESVFGPMVSLSSFFWSWNIGQLRHAPMFLEIRDPWTGWESLARIRRHFRNTDGT